MASEKAVATQVQIGARGRLRNRTAANMHLIDSTSWSGRFIILPETIDHSINGALFYTVQGDQGSIAAVKYSTTTPSGAPAAIVLAWDAPSTFDPSTSPNKIFGLFGSRSLIDNMTWDEVKKQLNGAGSGSSFEIIDPITMTMTGSIAYNPVDDWADISTHFLPPS